jgi:hypothetical protein
VIKSSIFLIGTQRVKGSGQISQPYKPHKSICDAKMATDLRTIGRRAIPRDPDHYLMIDTEKVMLCRVADDSTVREWKFQRQSAYDTDRVVDSHGRKVSSQPWVDCRLGKLLVVEWASAPPRQYTVWDIYTGEKITYVNLYYMFPPTSPIRAWITKNGVAVVSGPDYTHGTSWSYIPYTTAHHWICPVQTFLGCWVTDLLVDDTGTVVVVYDYEDDNIYAYDLEPKTGQIRGNTRGRSSVVPTGVTRVADGVIKLNLRNIHNNAASTDLMEI